MNTPQRTEYVTRDTILRLLSDEENARVSSAEGGTSLALGEEFVDLDKPDDGVRMADGQTSWEMGRVLPRSSVHDETWRRIVALLSAHETQRAQRHFPR